MPLPNNRRSVSVGNNVFENLYVYGDCEFDKDVTINGRLKYDELSLVRLTVTDKITAGIVTATTYYGDGSNLEVDGSSLSESISNSVPAGTVIYSASSTVPDGYIKANGAELLKTAYSDLYAEIGTTYGETDGNGGTGTSHFRVPDLRGEFIRGWDDGRGVDSGRGFGSFQNFQLAQHNHGVSNGTNQVRWTGGGSGFPNLGPGTPESYRLSFKNISTNNEGGSSNSSESRPRNVALLALIKY